MTSSGFIKLLSMGFNYAAQTFEKFALNYSIFDVWYCIFKIVIPHSIPTDKFLRLYTIMYSALQQYNALSVLSSSKKEIFVKSHDERR
jgi:hypothetical protein